MQFLKKVLQEFGLAQEADSASHLDPDIESFLREIATVEKRKFEEVVNDYLHFAIVEHQRDDVKQQLWESLTRREKQVAALSSMGLTNREIAGRMVVSTNTIKTHVRNVRDKLGAGTKAEIREIFAGWDFASWLEAQDMRGDD